MKFYALSMLLALVFAGSGVALAGPNGAIDLFWIDPQTGQADLNSCQGTTDFIPGVFGNIEISVQARLAGLTAAGIQAAELYVDGLENLPSRWRCNGQPVSGLMVGNICAPSLIGGSTHLDVSTAFNVCQTGSLVELFRLQISGASVTENLPSDMRIRVVAGSPPLNPAYPCSLLNLCDYPAFTKVCVTGGEFIINPQQQNCTVGLEPSTWSRVKGLYRG